MPTEEKKEEPENEIQMDLDEIDQINAILEGNE